jgi:3-hydroxyacyl-CoA dehydrogenase
MDLNTSANQIDLIAEIDECTRAEVVIASSSSGIPSSQFEEKCKHPGRILIG